jgi:hypothetical protein
LFCASMTIVLLPNHYFYYPLDWTGLMPTLIRGYLKELVVWISIYMKLTDRNNTNVLNI